MSLRRLYRHQRRHARFNFAVLLTIVFVAWVVVPESARLLDTLGGYHGQYEPKDAERAAWLQQGEEAPALLGHLRWETIVNITLFLLVAVVWLTLVPDRSPRRPRH
jgi:hypothetical protein